MKKTLIAALLCSMPLFAQDYPKTQKQDHVDTYHGVKVADPYRWLEDDHAPETLKWVEEQNKVTFGYLERIPFRAELLSRLKELYNYPKYSAPHRVGEDHYVYQHNTGLQNQNVLYIQKGLDGKPEVLLDPNTFSKDGTTKLGMYDFSKDGKWMAFSKSKGGSDWQEVHVMEVATRKELPDVLNWVKVSGIAWQDDGFYYSRYPAPTGGHELSKENLNHQVFYHKVGTAQDQDLLAFEDPAHPHRFHTVGTTEDERFSVLEVSDRGSGKKGNALFYRERGTTAWLPLVKEITDDSFGVVDNVGDQFLVQTDQDAPNGKVVQMDPKTGQSRVIVPEQKDAIQSASTGGGKLFVTYLNDVVGKVNVYSLDGKMEREVALPGAGAVGGFGGKRDDRFVFYSFSSLNIPSSIYRYDLASGQSTVFRASEIKNYDPNQFETRQTFYTSKDGTKIPLFLVYKKGLKLDGNNPTLLYGYGGFNVINYPAFSPLRIALLENGFVYASANLRGGGEYGENWHTAGTKLKKQNVFDDFIAAAEYLIANKYTNPNKLAIQGGSNGGLLVGAAINQRPELFKVALPAVGVMDMLRFHKFTIGWNWIPDYGSSENPDEFRALYAYSPLHNLKPREYPATLITTADHDDRVVPAHSFKYAATLQEMQKGKAPVLIRIDTKSGHGASSTTKQLEMTADVYAFLMHNLGVTPK